MTKNPDPQFEIINGIKYILTDPTRFGRVPCWTLEEMEKRRIKFFEGDIYYDEDAQDFKVFNFGKWKLLEDAMKEVYNIEIKEEK